MIRKRNNKVLNKKGSIQDLIFIAIIAFFVGLVFLIGFKLSNEYNTFIQASPIMPAESKAAGDKLTGYYPTVMDNAFLFLIIGVSIVTLIMASLVRVHPIFLVLFIIGWIFIVFLAGILSNVYDELANDPQLSTEASQMTKMSFVIGKLPLFIGVFGILLMIIMYKVWGGTSEG